MGESFIFLIKLLALRHTEKVGPGTQDPLPETLLLGPGIWERFAVSINKAQDAYLGTFTWDPKVEPCVWDPFNGTNTWDQRKITDFVYQSTLFYVLFYF